MKIFITSIGSFGYGPSIIKILRRSFEDITIYGADVTDENAAMQMVDVPIIAPPYSEASRQYIYDMCVKHKIDILLCMNVEEEMQPLLAWEEKEHLFEKNSTTIIGKGIDQETLAICVEKDRTYKELEKLELYAPVYYTPKNLHAFRADVKALGYPEKKVLIKPITGAGNRGLRILDATFDIFKDTIKNKPEATFTNLEEYEHVLALGDYFPDILVMEYLKGREYSVYCLTDQGKAITIVPLRRIKTTAGMSLIAEVELNEEVIDYSRDIIEKFKLHGVVDLQMKYNDREEPVLFEINPRYAASIVLPYAAGVDLAKLGILHALGKPLPKDGLQPRDHVRMIRYAEEIFVEGKDVFHIDRKHRSAR